MRDRLVWLDAVPAADRGYILYLMHEMGPSGGFRYRFVCMEIDGTIIEQRTYAGLGKMQEFLTERMGRDVLSGNLALLDLGDIRKEKA